MQGDAKKDGLPIVLVGLMGVGKSTIGRRLAARLGLPFVDADSAIEEAADLGIPDIFARYGEPYFRDGERRVIARLVEGGAKVIATGGGAFVNDDTRALVLERAIAVWLDADIGTLIERIGRRGGRPLLAGKDAGTVLRELAKTRNPLYAQAHIRVESRAGPHEATVEAIVAALNDRETTCA